MRCRALTNRKTRQLNGPRFTSPSLGSLLVWRSQASKTLSESNRGPTDTSSSLFIMEEDGEATGPTMAAEVEMAKEMKQNNYGRALEIFSAASTKNVRSACQPLRTVL